MNPTFIVMRKELKEMFRDKRVRNNATFMPAVIMLLMLSMLGFISDMVGKQNQIVHVVKTENQLIRQLREQKVKVTDIANLAEGEQLVRQGKARLVLQFESDFDAKVAADRPTRIDAYYDPQQEKGKIALGVVQG
jgi:sodium transport system permease protein